ncbi:MAG: patatin [Rhodospirillaceae bacterium]|nr:MAG: patatin [Rhodospirillaceae bacterium]
MTDGPRRLRVLSIDGGGMRGVYTGAYLSALAKQAAARRNTGDLDVGKAFDLIVGTSTGGIIACALAAGVPLDEVVDLFRRHGREIFPIKMPDGLNIDLFRQLFSRPKYLIRGANALQRRLEEKFGDMTVRQVYDQRRIALAIPAIEMSRHRSWVFKTPHLGGHRDDGFRLVDVCLATSAAPLYRSMARVENPTMYGHHHVFIDGGLWANNPVLVGMIDALQMTEPGDRIEIFSLGTCPPPAGDIFDADDMHRGLGDWKFGGEAAVIALDAQAFAYDNMAGMLAGHLDRDCHVVRFPRGDLPAKAMPYLDLDETSNKATKVLVEQALEDVSLTLSVCDRAADNDGNLLATLLKDLPPVEKQEATG